MDRMIDRRQVLPATEVAGPLGLDVATVRGLVDQGVLRPGRTKPDTVQAPAVRRLAALLVQRRGQPFWLRRAMSQPATIHPCYHPRQPRRMVHSSPARSRRAIASPTSSVAICGPVGCV
jgi:hypothetical protein